MSPVQIVMFPLFYLALAEREKTPCERHREAATTTTTTITTNTDSGIFSFFRPRPAVGQYIPQCDEHGAYKSTQCHTTIGQCWCVDASGQEIPNTRTGSGSTSLCESRDRSPLQPPFCSTLPRVTNELHSPAQVSTRQ